MTGIVIAICVILIFGLIILIHELGHFLTAKIFSVTVHEFAIGMGPKLLGWGRGETLYSLRLIPMGGYVRMEGEDEDSPSEGAFSNQKPWKRLIILFAGAFMNLVLGLSLLLVYNAANPMMEAIPTMEVSAVVPGMGAEQAGILAGDEILSLDGTKIGTQLDLQMALYEKENVSAVILRQDKKLTAVIPVTEVDGIPRLGIQRAVREKSFWNVLSYSYFETFSIVKMTYQAFFGMFTGTVSVDQMSGPVGIVTEIGSAVQRGFFDVLFIAILITLNLGVVNLFPLPALDGGRIVFVLWEMITKRKLKAEYEGIIHFIGFVILIFFMIYITKNDIVRLFIK